MKDSNLAINIYGTREQFSESQILAAGSCSVFESRDKDKDDLITQPFEMLAEEEDVCFVA
jgi:hypothetical protein